MSGPSTEHPGPFEPEPAYTELPACESAGRLSTSDGVVWLDLAGTHATSGERMWTDGLRFTPEEARGAAQALLLAARDAES